MAPRSADLKSLVARFWFPLALIGLLVLAIPGVLLFALNLLGWEGRISDWLQDRFHLSYHLPLAGWVALTLLLVPFAIVLLYFLKLKRKPLAVPSTFLWRKSIEDIHVNSLFQWLRENVLLLLQLLAILILIYAVMDFRVHGRGYEGKHFILMIDNSASMAATDVLPSRLHWAKQEALKEIEAASEGDSGMVIVFSSSAEIYQSYTTNRGELRRAVERIEQTQRPTRIEEALSLADSLANPNRSAEDAGVRPAGEEPGKARTYVAAEGIPTEVHLFSDGRFPDVRDFTLGKLNLHFHAAGTPGPEQVDNIGLVTLNALRDEQDPSKLQVFVRALNFRNQPVDAKVQLDVLVQGTLRAIQEKSLKLPARQVVAVRDAAQEQPDVRDTPGEGAATFELNDVDDGSTTVLHAKLVHGGDHFAFDDEAWLVVGVVRKARVLVVGRPNELLRAFFDDEATRAVATVAYLSPTDLAKEVYRKPALNGQYDLIVFDRCAPEKEEEMPRGNTFFIGAPPPPWQPNTLERLTHPQIRGWMGNHSLMRYLTGLQEVGLADAFRMKDLPPRTPRLIETDQNTALLLTLSRQAFTDLVMTFPLITDKDEWNTNWWRLPSFPLFLRNVLYTLGNISDGAAEETLQAGQVKILRPDVAVGQIDITSPEGKTQTLHRGTRADFAFGDTNRLGVYQVGWDGSWRRSFAVNLLDADESHIEPRAAVQIGAERIVAGQQRGQPRALWKWLVLLALGLLLTEWYIYNRRVYI